MNASVLKTIIICATILIIHFGDRIKGGKEK